MTQQTIHSQEVVVVYWSRLHAYVLYLTEFPFCWGHTCRFHKLFSLRPMLLFIFTATPRVKFIRSETIWFTFLHEPFLPHEWIFQASQTCCHLFYFYKFVLCFAEPFITVKLLLCLLLTMKNEVKSRKLNKDAPVTVCLLIFKNSHTWKDNIQLFSLSKTSNTLCN